MLGEDVGTALDPIEALASWSEQWTMVDGRIGCNFCHRSQYPSDAGQQFIHGAHCISTNATSLPWRDLKAILLLEE